jgi:hypothetical protein
MPGTSHCLIADYRHTSTKAVDEPWFRCVVVLKGSCGSIMQVGVVLRRSYVEGGMVVAFHNVS